MRISMLEILGKTEQELREYTIKALKSLGYEKDIIETNDYVFAKGNIPVLLVAHLDTVHRELPEIVYDRMKGILWSPQGIGGDDRCGVYAILKICRRFKPYVLFTTQEEVGGVGARIFTEEIDRGILEPINFAIEIDRRGRGQAVFYDCGNKEFQEMITSFGFKKEWGSFSDISVLSPKYDFASVNLSAGYYNEHQKVEFIVMNDLYYTIGKVEKILASENVNKKYNYQEVLYINNYYTYKFNDNTKDFEKVDDKQEELKIDDDLFKQYFIEDWYGMTEEEFEYAYGFAKPTTYKEAVNVINEFINDSKEVE